MRSAALRPEPVSTATVVSPRAIVPSPNSRVSAAPAVAAVGSTKSPSRPKASNAGAISPSPTATTPKQLTRSKLGDQPSGATRRAARPEKTDGSARGSWGLGL